MREGLQLLSSKGAVRKDGTRVFSTTCQNRPVPFTEVRQTPAEAARLCGRGTDQECPLIKLCEPLGFTESVYADDMVYGGITWRKGLPLVSETGYEAVRGKGELRKLKGTSHER
jgi:hypothetical protein